jgi:general stress protein 26
MHTTRRAGPGDLEKLYERLKEFDTAMFTTVGKDGKLHSRPMMTQEREKDADLWFVTSMDTTKVLEMRANPQVGITYFRDRDQAYVSVSGKARIEIDRDLIKRKWKESWRAWFPDGPESPDICLMKVEVTEAEYWEPQGGTLYVIFEQVRGALTGDHPEINPPERLKLE